MHSQDLLKKMVVLEQGLLMQNEKMTSLLCHTGGSRIIMRAWVMYKGVPTVQYLKILKVNNTNDTIL